jgi:hypothetical protein
LYRDLIHKESDIVEDLRASGLIWAWEADEIVLIESGRGWQKREVQPRTLLTPGTASSLSNLIREKIIDERGLLLRVYGGGVSLAAAIEGEQFQREWEQFLAGSSQPITVAIVDIQEEDFQRLVVGREPDERLVSMLSKWDTGPTQTEQIWETDRIYLN